MGEPAKRVIHLPGKVKNGVPLPLCGRVARADMIVDDPSRATCRGCVDRDRYEKEAEEDRWYRDQEDYYGETL
jgi:hypothetical protein